MRECVHAGTVTGGHLEFSITLCLVSSRQGLLMNRSLSVSLSLPSASINNPPVSAFIGARAAEVCGVMPTFAWALRAEL